MIFLLISIALVFLSLTYVGFVASRAPDGTEDDRGFRVTGETGRFTKFPAPRRSALLPSAGDEGNR